MVWGNFDRVLERLREELAATDPGLPPVEALRGAVVATSRYDDEQLAKLRTRMMLITRVPALQAHSTIRYSAWRRVVAEFAAERLGAHPDGLLPQAIAQAALGTSMAAFTHWVRTPEEDLERCLDEALGALAAGFKLDPPR